LLNHLARSPDGSPVAETLQSMTNITLADLAHVTGGANKKAAPGCTFSNPSGARQSTQSFENNHSGPSANERVMKATNTLTSRGMSMLNDARPTMPDQW
jgi:hypothetical protein